MGVGAVLEPLVVVTLLFGGVFVNRNRAYSLGKSNRPRRRSQGDEEGRPASPTSSTASDDALLNRNRSSSPSLLTSPGHAKWRRRELSLWGFKATVTSPNTRVFEDRWFSRLIRKFPFLVEAWYWALIYWVYQLGRAFTALTLVEGTVDVARRHALQVIAVEQWLHIFWEVPIQKFFLGHPFVLMWINRIYSFIHIPGTILFLVWLYWYTTTCNRMSSSLVKPLTKREDETTSASSGLRARVGEEATPTGPALYEARRRTMGFCNLLAFIVFTLWPCMPPRLLSDPHYDGTDAKLSKSFGFVDTVHGDGGEVSVWTQNKFCNQYAAMPSLHFGYSLLVGLTIMTIPLAENRHSDNQASALSSGSTKRLSIAGAAFHVRVPSPRRLMCVALGFLYPFIILVAIVSTANHFILDAVAGATVCCIAWNCNRVLLNLLPFEDWLLWCVRLHFPEKYVVRDHEEEAGEYSEVKA